MDQKTAAGGAPDLKGATAKGGLESADVWGDADDPMSEINAMTNEELITKTREFEAEIRKGKTNLTRMQNEIK